MTSRRLDTSGLDVFEAELRRVGAPVLDHLRQGLAFEQMDLATASLDVQLPREARVWWGWHDGADRDVALAAQRELGPAIPFLSLREAVEHANWWRETSGEFEQTLIESGYEPVTWWPDTWLPISRRDSAGTLALECAGGEDDPVTVTYVAPPEPPPNWGGADPPQLGSLAELVDVWVAALRSGMWSVSSHGNWERWPERFPHWDSPLRHFV